MEGFAAGAGQVGGSQVAEERLVRPLVGGHMVQNERYHPAVGPEVEEGGPQRQVLRQVEGPAHEVGDRGLDLGGVAGGPDVDGHLRLVRGHHHLGRLTLVAGGVGHHEPGPQRLVAAHDVAERGLNLVDAGELRGHPERELESGDVCRPLDRLRSVLRIPRKVEARNGEARVVAAVEVVRRVILDDAHAVDAKRGPRPLCAGRPEVRSAATKASSDFVFTWLR